MKTQNLVLAFFCLVAGVFADTVKLNNGTMVEGDIIAETDTEYTVERSLASGSIKTKDAVRKSDVAEVTRATPEQKAAAAMQQAHEATKRYQLNPMNSFPKEYYDQVLSGSFRKFLTDFPNSTFSAEMQERIATWEAERDKVVAGQVKRSGQWLAAEQVAAMESKQLLQQVNAALANRRYDIAVPLLDKLLASNTPSNLVTTAQEMRVKAYQDWLQSLEQSLARLEDMSVSNSTTIAAAKEQLDKAHNALRAASQKASGSSFKQSGQDTGGGKRRTRGKGGGSAPRMGQLSDAVQHDMEEVANREKKLADLERKQADLNMQLASVRHILPQVQTRMTELGIEAAPVVTTTKVSTQTEPPPPPPPPPPPEKDLLTQIADCAKKYWLFVAGGLLLVIWIISRKLGQ